MNLNYGKNLGFASNETEAAFPWLWNNLIGLWDPSMGIQGGRLFDYSSRRMHVTFVSGANYRWADGGPRGHSVWTNGGGNDYPVSVATGALDGATQFTYMGWFNQHILDQINGFLMYGTKAVFTQYISMETYNDGILYFEINTDFVGFDYSTLIAQQTWFHIAFVFDGSLSSITTKMKIFVNGKPVTITNTAGVGPTAVSSINGLIYLGQLDTNNQWLGRYTDVRLYKRALTPAEILASMVLSPLELASEEDGYGKAISAAAAQSLVFTRLAALQPLIVR